MNTDKKSPLISIIIPTLNEEDSIASTIRSARAASNVEVIVVDGGSTDQTAQIARSCGVIVLKSKLGRAIQMNRGSEIASGEILLFLHADTHLPENFDTHVIKIMAKQNVSCGAFRFSLDARGMKFRIIEFGVSLRTILFGVPYGDQAIFVRKKLFREVGRFPEIPLMEDVALVKKLNQKGKTVIAQSRAISSARRWQAIGALRTTFINYSSILAYSIGFSPSRIANWYRI